MGERYAVMIKDILKCFFALMFISVLGAAAGTGNARIAANTSSAVSVTTRRDILEPVLAGLSDRITKAIDEDRLVSVSMAIVLDHDIIFCQAFGHADLEDQRTATSRTIYPMGSVTKVFTATMLAQLWERGVVSLDDPVQKYLPEYQPQSPFKGILPTTLRQLASHTSGLPRDAAVNFWCDYSGFLWLVTGGQTPMTFYVDRDSLLASLGDLELAYPPEVYAHYSNLNIQVLGLALERACGQPFTAYVEKEILGPLGMKDSGFNLEPEQRKRLATGYVCTGPAVEPLVAPRYDLGCAIYSGGLFTTAEDLAHFVSSQWPDDQEAANTILKLGTLRRMRTPQSVHRMGVHTCYGLGWAVVRIGGHEAIEHNGALMGYHAHVSAVPSLRLGIVAMSNTKNFLWRPDACKELARDILADLADALVAAAAQKKEFEPANVDMTDFEGRYALPGDFAHLEVIASGDGLKVTLLEASDFSEMFEPVASNTFCFSTDPKRKPMLFFKTNPEGKINSVSFLGHSFKRLRSR
jgi:CubicO group peptidase (beta-lactamase class C family)